MLTTPFFCACSAISIASDGSLVVISMSTLPDLQPASAPSPPNMTCRTSRGKPTIETTTSEFAATSRGEAAHWRRFDQLAGLFFCAGENRRLVAGRNQVAAHRATHHASADPADTSFTGEISNCHRRPSSPQRLWKRVLVARDRCAPRRSRLTSINARSPRAEQRIWPSPSPTTTRALPMATSLIERYLPGARTAADHRALDSSPTSPTLNAVARVAPGGRAVDRAGAGRPAAQHQADRQRELLVAWPLSVPWATC